MNRAPSIQVESFLAIVLGNAIAVFGQSPVVLIRQGEQPAGFPKPVLQMGNPAAFHDGSYSLPVSTSAAGVAELGPWYLWGEQAGSSPQIARTQGELGFPYLEWAFEPSVGLLPAGSLVWSGSRLTGLGVDGRVDDLLWKDRQLIARSNADPLPVPGMTQFVWTYTSRPAATALGGMLWLGGFAEAGPVSTNHGLFAWHPGSSPTVLVKGGDVIDQLGTVDPGASIGSHFAVSASGAEWLALVSIQGAPSGNNTALIRNGAALLISGLPLRSGDLVSLYGALPGERWEQFVQTGVSDTGHWFVVARTTAASPENEIIIKNGYIYRRSGTALGGTIILPPVLDAVMNESGDLAVLWSTDTGRVLSLNDEILASSGDEVTFIASPTPPYPATVTISDFGGGDALSISGRDPNGQVQVVSRVALDTAATPLPFDDIAAVIRSVGSGPGSTECYANCDGSTVAPVLNAADYSCFLSRFAAADLWANCDGSTVEPVLNAADYSCFLQKFAVGCN